MPRTLPWATNGSSSGTKRHGNSVARPSKRRKKIEDASESEVEGVDGVATSKEGRVNRELSTSPGPTESFMITGLDDDNGYRIVEDEFLTIAGKFTSHFHAAEYQRLVEDARSRNAQAISSLARPVTGRMPDQTRRKVEGVRRAKKQHSTIKSIIGDSKIKGVNSDDSEDSEGLPYVGTSLHGLMESPRKNNLNLSGMKSKSTTNATRAAAGFRQPALAHQPSSQSPKSNPKTVPAISRDRKHREASNMESANDTDDLDTEYPVPKVSSKGSNLSNTIDASSDVKIMPTKPLPERPVLRKKDASIEGDSTHQQRLGSVTTKSTAVNVDPFDFAFNHNSRVAKKLEQARLQREQEEREQKAKRMRGNIIPRLT